MQLQTHGQQQRIRLQRYGQEFQMQSRQFQSQLGIG
ncbi:hypothetical protein J2Z43_000112 [Clostridioides mangenotii]|uniref:Uncharacterized protein n=1 Tax=Metaclostridioides mangenotii TaxID=1540 RepID=A0ABS4E6Z7_9FIRM|nr:hypothetical protein [Clostridioides mangenotii]